VGLPPEKPAGVFFVYLPGFLNPALIAVIPDHWGCPGEMSFLL